ncbi:MAG: Mammalian cell entry related domain protein [Segetibacter sp.]|jgi:phospholipid/cholesterol/gamma-HCH transport system substrate-binding protein|nr:Mammalian cell entry related domain protein [Segetibacter sp.]
MKSNKNTRAFVVGIFIFLGIAIFVVTVLTLGGQQKTFQKSIVVRAIFDDINGLQKGNNIWFSGVKIGTVKKISFVGNSQVEVDMNIDEASKQYIRKNAKARISSDGLIGNKIIVLYAGASKSPSVENGDLLGVEKASNPDEMMATFQANNQNLFAITTDVKGISKRITEGKGTVGKLLTDETLVNDLHSTMLRLRQASANAERLSATIAAFAEKLQRKGTLANDLVTDTTVFNRLKATAAQIESVSKNASIVVDNLNNTSSQLGNSLNNKSTPVGMLLNDEDAAADIRVILSNLQAGSQKLNDDLEAVQHNFLLRGFFKKKAKKEEEEKKKAEELQHQQQKAIAPNP